VKKKLKREGYNFVKENKSFSEKIAIFISTAFKGAIPVCNIVNTIIILYMGDKLYDYMENKLLEEGKIYKSNEKKINNKSENHALNKEKGNTFIANVQKTRTEKTYNEMTIEEKLAYLQQEKERLINQSTQQVENPFTLRKRRK